MDLAPQVRPIPLKIAGMIGMLTAAVYLAVALGQVGGIGPAMLWLVLMATAALLAWFADRFEGRRPAMTAAGIFFVLSLVSPLGLALVFLVAVVLCLIGFVDFASDES